MDEQQRIDLERLTNQQRYELDVMAMRLEAARAAYDRQREALEAARATIAALEHRLGEAHQGLTVADEQG